jgi:hypothetical protein
MKYKEGRNIPVSGSSKIGEEAKLYSVNYTIYHQLLEVSSQDTLRVLQCQPNTLHKLHSSFQGGGGFHYSPSPKSQNPESVKAWYSARRESFQTEAFQVDNIVTKMNFANPAQKFACNMHAYETKSSE